ncbi:hypothetical protein OU800_04505 [Pseudomonas sp. GOM7]|uniref:hypothetical protein n=1 Tax=Pseudomonas sp. GOM7 TaxID=2998079 RepID=UPI00227ADDC3|nr:hypothetical protein [Pseudomonas sp. GOM7]WAJ38504.1 hypothetical protein OU800_04505 [Pseudomonas sp. GOM7]
MLSLRRLFNPRKPLRHFALLDAQGICRALRQCEQPPEGGRWVEVSESRMSWLGSALPASARLMPASRQARATSPLAA